MGAAARGGRRPRRRDARRREAAPARETRRGAPPVVSEPTPAEAGRAAAARRPRPLVVASLAVFLPLALLLFDPRLFTGGDNVVYYLLGRALAEGRGYVTLHEPGAPVHTFYPPGYPVLLVPALWLSGGSFLATKALSLLAAVVALLLAGPYLARRLPDGAERELVLGGALLLTATNTTFLEYSHWTLSEMPFLALSLGALLLAERPRQSAPVWAGAALLAAAGYLVRTAGLPLCLAVAWAAWRGAGWRAGASSLAIAAAAVGGWAARNALVAADAPGYLTQLLLADPYDPAAGTLTAAAVAGRVALNLETYVMLELPRLVWPFLPGAGASPSQAARALGLALGVLLVAGVLRQVRGRGVRAGEVYAILYCAVLAIWPWNGERFLLPLLPLLLSYVGLGAAGSLAALLRARPGRRWTRAATTVVLGVLLTPNLAHAAAAVPAQLRVTVQHLRGERLAGYDWFDRDYFTALLWARDNLPQGSVIVSRKPQFTYYWSGHASVLYPYLGPDAIEAAIREAGANALVLDRLGLSVEIYLVPYLREHLDAYDIAFTTGDPPTAILVRRR